MFGVPTSLHQIEEYLTTLLGSVDRVNDALDALNATANDTLEAVVDLSNLLDRSLEHISQQIVAQQETLDDIAVSLRQPNHTRARELRNEADKWLNSGMERKGRERDEDWKDAMRLLKSTTDNPIGMQDYVAFFQIGWLLWKHEHDVVGAEDAFYRAQRLSSSKRDLYYALSLRHLAYMQYLLNKHEDAYETIHKALEVSSDHDTFYDVARYAAITGREGEAVNFLDKCIERQPTTIITMFSEPDFRSILPALQRLAARRLQEVRKRIESKRERCQLVLQGAADAGKLLTLKFDSLQKFTTEVETIGQRLGKTDYLTALGLEKRVLEVRERIVVECTRGIQDEIATRRSTVRRTEDHLRQIRGQAEAMLEQAKREGSALIEKARTIAAAETSKARFDLQACESEHAQKERDATLTPRASHWGLGCLTHFVVAMFIMYLIMAARGGKPPDSNSPVLGFWLLFGWILFAYLYSWLSMQFRLHSSESAVSEKLRAAEQIRSQQERMQQEARSAADRLCARARLRSVTELDERITLLQDNLRTERNAVSQAESVLSTFSSLR